MAGNTQMNENERGIFKLNGITGMLIAVVLLLSILGFLVFNALMVQQRETSNFYKINQDLNALKMNSSENYKQYQLVGTGK
jgi:ABC-type phosphate transport system permease subunit